MLVSAIRDIWEIFKQYTDQAIVFALIFMSAYIIILVLDSLIRIIKHKKVHSIGHVLLKTCLFALLGIYLSYILAITLSGRETISNYSVRNVDPFSTIYRNGQLNKEVFENFLMFVPLGILMPSVWKYLRGPVRTTIIGFVLSVVIEISQVAFKRGHFDVDDIIFNTLGAIAGYILFAGFYDGMLALKRRILTDAARKLKKTPPLGKLYDRFALRHDFARVILQLILVVIWANIVMDFSSDTGEESGSLSTTLLKFILKLFTADTADSTLGSIGEQSELFLMLEKILRKCAHMFEYAVLTFLIWATIYAARKVIKIIAYSVPLLGAFVVGMIDETNQMSVVGRTGTYSDVVIDMIGSITALFITFLIVNLIEKYYIRKYS